MNGPVLRRAAAVVLAAAGCVSALPSTASAGGDMFFSRSSGTTAAIEWLEAGTIGTLPGNWHFGELWVEDLGRGRSVAFGTVYDVQCQDGVQPYNPGGHGGHPDGEPPVEEPAPGCELVGLRFLDAAPGQLAFSTTKKLTSARLTGNLSVGDGHGGATATPPVDITMTAVGSPYSSTESGTYTDEYGTYTYRYSFTGRQVAVTPGSSYIGGMVFDDEAGESSSAQLGTYRSSERQRG